MPDKKTILLFVSCWLLLAVLTLPSGASAAPVPQVAVDGPGSSDVFPIMENQPAVRQAHLVYLAVKEEVGMQATIRYIAARNGSTGTLSDLMVKTDTSVHTLGSAGSDAMLDAELENLRRITRMFREETDRQMNTVGGNPVALRADIASAVAGSPELPLLMDRYWTIRENTELADFDLRVSRARGTLSTLSENGHEIAPAQKKLEEIVTMRTELAAALRSRNDAGIELAHKKIHTASVEYARIISSTKSTAAGDTRTASIIDQCSGVMTRSGMMNVNLGNNGVDTARADELVMQGKIQILEAQNRSRVNNNTGAKETLMEFRKTLQALRDTYRMILAQEDLPQATAQGVLSVAQSLDITAAGIAEL
ncbi:MULTISPECIES: hypothetical protein [unclassified Methanoregula]|uniref:hypothetical protein n=1 Tax=unclassified Methanoregula TaxID=2649730 RepID=UPI0009C664BF|nr:MULTISPECIES: hypothetical protein [unclassified Methanoregula]OPX62739.1 MAG: hypothetical protein A4E33_02126 [Methanoregula sp. PtaB.Bin085]OPY36961.1 MAG: hypothetical protein A4E34_00141 [Methanoregula sp. PtaU1.Bin006]